jgi:hypothetical protein
MYPSLIWYTDGKDIAVSQYIPSEATISLDSGEVRLSQSVHMKNYNNQVLFDEHSGGRVSRWSLRFHVSTDLSAPFTLKLRVPAWCAGAPEVSLNGDSVQAEIRDGYLLLARVWKEDELDIFFPSAIRFEPLEGAPEMAAAVEGPVVLAALTDHDCGLTVDPDHPEKALLPEIPHTYDVFVWQQSTWRTRRQPANFRFVPLYEVTDETYTVYFTLKQGND